MSTSQPGTGARRGRVADADPASAPAVSLTTAMGVEVVQLRMKGDKLQRESVRDAQPVVDKLTVRSRLGPGKGVAVLSDEHFQLLFRP